MECMRSGVGGSASRGASWKGAQILLLAIFPRGETPDDLTRRHNARINALLPALADGRHIHFLDIGAAFLGADGRLSREVMPDLLHLSPQAYQTWARAIAPTLKRLTTSP